MLTLLCALYGLEWFGMGGVKRGRIPLPMLMSHHSLRAYQVPGAKLSTSTLHVLPQLIIAETLFGWYLY